MYKQPPPFPELDGVDVKSEVEGFVGVMQILRFETFPSGDAGFKVQALAWIFDVSKAGVHILVMIMI